MAQREIRVSLRLLLGAMSHPREVILTTCVNSGGSSSVPPLIHYM